MFQENGSGRGKTGRRQRLGTDIQLSQRCLQKQTKRKVKMQTRAKMGDGARGRTAVSGGDCQPCVGNNCHTVLPQPPRHFSQQWAFPKAPFLFVPSLTASPFLRTLLFLLVLFDQIFTQGLQTCRSLSITLQR